MGFPPLPFLLFPFSQNVHVSFCFFDKKNIAAKQKSTTLMLQMAVNTPTRKIALKFKLNP